MLSSSVRLEEHAVNLDRHDPGLDQLASPLLGFGLALAGSCNDLAAHAAYNLPHDGSFRLRV